MMLQRNALLFTMTCTLGALACADEVEHFNPFEYSGTGGLEGVETGDGTETDGAEAHDAETGDTETGDGGEPGDGADGEGDEGNDDDDDDDDDDD